MFQVVYPNAVECSDLEKENDSGHTQIETRDQFTRDWILEKGEMEIFKHYKTVSRNKYILNILLCHYSHPF